MNKEQLKRIFEFLKNKENHNLPVKWKLINYISLTEEELNVKGDLNLFNTKITSFPEGLKVKGYLNLINCEILTSLPKGLEVGQDLYIAGTELKKYTDDELREMVKLGFIKGKILR